MSFKKMLFVYMFVNSVKPNWPSDLKESCLGLFFLLLLLLILRKTVDSSCLYFLILYCLFALAPRARVLIPSLLSPPGQDKCPESQQRGRSLLHSGWRPGLGYAGGFDRVLLQIQGRGEENEGGKECTDF